MRGHPLLVGLLIVTLGLPLAGAIAPQTVDADPVPRTPSSVEPIRLYAPAEAFVGHPIHLVVAVPDPASPEAFLAHQDLRVAVALNDDLLFASAAIHEHDGFHPLVVTATQPGTLRLWADFSTGGPTPADNGTTMRSLPNTGVRHELEVQPAPVSGHYGPGPYRDNVTVHLADFPSVRLERTDHGPHFGANIDVFSPDGRLLMNAWPDDGDYGIWLDFPVAHMTGTLRALTLATPGAHHTTFTETLEATFANDTQATVPVGWPDLGDPDCRDDVGLLVDPNSNTAGGLTFAQHTDIRIHLPPTNTTIPPPNNRAGQLDLRMSVHAIAARGASEWTTYSADLFAGNPSITFHPPGPGAYSIYLEGARVPNGCTTPFVVLQEPQPLPPGTLAADIAVDDDDATVQLRAERAEQVLAHYEFDTRVVRTHTDDESGRLVWKGKLHGHGGIASFRVASLEPGAYEVQVFPSPQDPGTPPVSADGPRGFVYGFVVEGPPEPAATPSDDVQAAPGVAAPWLPLVALASFLIRRRK